jgi:hypothetical protein
VLPQTCTNVRASSEQHLLERFLISPTRSLFIPRGVISFFGQSFRRPPAGDGRPKALHYAGGHSSLSVTHNTTSYCVRRRSVFPCYTGEELRVYSLFTWLDQGSNTPTFGGLPSCLHLCTCPEQWKGNHFNPLGCFGVRQTSSYSHSLIYSRFSYNAVYVFLKITASWNFAQ